MKSMNDPYEERLKNVLKSFPIDEDDEIVVTAKGNEIAPTWRNQLADDDDVRDDTVSGNLTPPHRNTNNNNSDGGNQIVAFDSSLVWGLSIVLALMAISYRRRHCASFSAKQNETEEKSNTSQQGSVCGKHAVHTLKRKRKTCPPPVITRTESCKTRRTQSSKTRPTLNIVEDEKPVKNDFRLTPPPSYQDDDDNEDEDDNNEVAELIQEIVSSSDTIIYRKPLPGKPRNNRMVHVVPMDDTISEGSFDGGMQLSSAVMEARLSMGQLMMTTQWQPDPVHEAVAMAEYIAQFKTCLVQKLADHGLDYQLDSRTFADIAMASFQRHKEQAYGERREARRYMWDAYQRTIDRQHSERRHEETLAAQREEREWFAKLVHARDACSSRVITLAVYSIFGLYIWSCGWLLWSYHQEIQAKGAFAWATNMIFESCNALQSERSSDRWFIFLLGASNYLPEKVKSVWDSLTICHSSRAAGVLVFCFLILFKFNLSLRIGGIAACYYFLTNGGDVTNHLVATACLIVIYLFLFAYVNCNFLRIRKKLEIRQNHQIAPNNAEVTSAVQWFHDHGCFLQVAAILIFFATLGILHFFRACPTCLLSKGTSEAIASCRDCFDLHPAKILSKAWQALLDSKVWR